MAAIDEDIWSEPSVIGSQPADPSLRIGFSVFITSERVYYKEVLTKLYEAINKEYGTSIPVPEE